MTLGKWTNEKQKDLFVATFDLPRSLGHPFYLALNALLAEARFDEYVEVLCRPAYKDGGRPGIPPGVFFRMLFVGYFEGIDSQRGIAWRCSDSLSLRSFLGLSLTERSPDHSSLTVIRKRLSAAMIEQVFSFVLKLALEKGLLKGKTVGIDSTTLEANAAMKSIVRRDDGATYNEYLAKLAKEAGIEEPTNEDLRRFDRGRKDKKTSNEDWQSASDPDARITRMKDGTTHLAYKAEHVVDLDTNVVIAASIHHADSPDGETFKDTIIEAESFLMDATAEACSIEEIAGDKGYNKTETLAWAAEMDIRTYIPEPKHQHGRRWDDKPEGWQSTCYATRRRTARAKGKEMQRARSEKVERTFAHICETGRARRSWIRGITEVSKRYLMQVAAHNLGVILRSLLGVGTPRGWAGLSEALRRALGKFSTSLEQVLLTFLALASRRSGIVVLRFRVVPLRLAVPEGTCSTGCQKGLHEPPLNHLVAPGRLHQSSRLRRFPPGPASTK